MQEDDRISFTQPELWKKHLQRQGYVVISNYLSKSECEYFLNEAWHIVEVLSNGKINRSSTVSQQEPSNYFPMVRGGIIPYVGHSQMQWNLRKKCRPIFEQIWSTKELKSSFDCLCFMNGRKAERQLPLNEFLHSDQGALRDYTQCYQGIICLTNNGPQEGGFVAAPGSHLIHHSYIVQKGKQYINDCYYRCDEEDLKQFPFSNCKKINNKEGDFILWDSRTFHTNAYPQRPIQRVCQYICMVPSDSVSAAALEERKKAVISRLASSHNPADGFTLHREVENYLTKSTPHLKEAVIAINNAVFDYDVECLI